MTRWRSGEQLTPLTVSVTIILYRTFLLCAEKTFTSTVQESGKKKDFMVFVRINVPTREAAIRNVCVQIGKGGELHNRCSANSCAVSGAVHVGYACCLITLQCGYVHT